MPTIVGSYGPSREWGGRVHSHWHKHPKSPADATGLVVTRLFRNLSKSYDPLVLTFQVFYSVLASFLGQALYRHLYLKVREMRIFEGCAVLNICRYRSVLYVVLEILRFRVCLPETSIYRKTYSAYGNVPIKITKHWVYLYFSRSYRMCLAGVIMPQSIIPCKVPEQPSK